MTDSIQRYRQHHDQGVITDRQLEVLELRVRFSLNTIAHALNISRSTVRSHERDALNRIARHERRPAA